MHELAVWAPLSLDVHVEHRARSMSRATAREARWRAEGLVEEARAAEERLEAAAAIVRMAARSAEQVRAAMAAAMVEGWRAKPAGIEVNEEAQVCDLLVLVVACLATALGEMEQRISKELDRSSLRVLRGQQKLRRAQQVECCAQRLWQTWLDEECVWWRVLAAAAAALDEEAGQPLSANAGDGGRGDGGGGGDGAGPAEGGDDTPSAGQRHADRRNNCDDTDGGSGGRDGTDGGGGRDGGGEATPPSRRAAGSAGEWTGDGVRSWARRTWHGAEKEKLRGGDRAEELGGAEECRSAGRGTRRMRPLGWRRWLVQLRLGPAARGCCIAGRPGEGKIHPRTGGAAATGGTTVLSLSLRWSGGGRRRRMERERGAVNFVLLPTPHTGLKGGFVGRGGPGSVVYVCVVGGDGSLGQVLAE